MQNLFDLGSKEDPALVEQVLNYFDLDALKQLMIQLIRDQKSIRNFSFILENLCQCGKQKYNLETCLAQLKLVLAKTESVEIS